MFIHAIERCCTDIDKTGAFGVRTSNKKISAIILVCSIVLLLTLIHLLPREEEEQAYHRSLSPDVQPVISLAAPRYNSDVSLEETLLRRRSTRDYTEQALTLKELSQLLWASQGVTDPRGLRTAPSAGALYPLEVLILVGNVEGLEAGLYRYRPQTHSILKVLSGDRRGELAEAALGQKWVGSAAIDIVVTAIHERTTGKYGDRGIRYVHIEVGHAAQNLCLQATALKLGVVTVGAFHDDRVSQILNLPQEEKPLYIVSVGRPTPP